MRSKKVSFLWKKKLKTFDNEVMMRECLFGSIRLIYEAINLFISVHNSDGSDRRERRKKVSKKREIWAYGMLCQQYRSANEIRADENTERRI